MTTDTKLDLTAEHIDVRDIIARVEELQTELESISGKDAGDFGGLDAWLNTLEQTEEVAEMRQLSNILDQLRGNGGDEEWHGDWYPVTLIRDQYFEDHARSLCDDCGLIPKDLPDWIAIDWETTAENIRVDYSSVEIDGSDYWYR